MGTELQRTPDQTEAYMLLRLDLIKYKADASFRKILRDAVKLYKVPKWIPKWLPKKLIPIRSYPEADTTRKGEVFGTVHWVIFGGWDVCVHINLDQTITLAIEQDGVVDYASTKPLEDVLREELISLHIMRRD